MRLFQITLEIKLVVLIRTGFCNAKKNPSRNEVELIVGPFRTVSNFTALPDKMKLFLILLMSSDNNAIQKFTCGF